METPVGRALLRLTGVSLVAVAVVALVAPRPVNVAYDRWVVVPVTLLLVVVALTVRVPGPLRARWVPATVSVAGGALATVLGLVGRYDFGWDARVVLEMARSLAAGRGLGAQDYDYLSLYPNNIPLLAIERVGAEVGAALGISPVSVLVTLTGLCVAMTMYAAHLLVAPVAGRGRALLTQLVILALVGVSPWVAVPYTDFYAMPFVVGGIALALAAWRRRAWWPRIALGAMAVGAIAVAYAIKTTPAVIVVALVVVGLVRLTDRWSPGRAKAVLVGVLGVSVAFLLTSAGLAAGAAAVAGIDRSQVRPDGTPPVTWWLANGMNEAVTPDGIVQYGTYDRAMVDAVKDLPPAEAMAWSRDYIADRWAERGPAGTAAFYANKAAWNWGDGMFWAWGEGPDSLPGRVVPQTAAAEAVHAVNGYHGSWYRWRADVTQALWLAVLVVAGAGLLATRRVRRETLVLAVTVLGIAAFTLCFQGRSRYLFAFVPVVVALAAVVAPRLMSRRTAPKPLAGSG